MTTQTEAADGTPPTAPTQEDRPVSNTQETATPTLAETQDAADAAWAAKEAAWRVCHSQTALAQQAAARYDAALAVWREADDARIAAEEAAAANDEEWGGA